VEVLHGSMEGEHLVITCSLTVNNQEITSHSLIDCGATGIAFMDQDFACHHQIPLQEVNQKKQVEDNYRRPIESGDITHPAREGIKIQEHQEQLPRFITKFVHYPIVLGIPWLCLHGAAVHFASNTVTFGSQYCISHCHNPPVKVQGGTEEPSELIYQATELFEPQIRPLRRFRRNIVLLHGASFFRIVKKGCLTVCKEFHSDIN